MFYYFQSAEYTTISQSILLRSIVDGDKSDIETFPTTAIANATIIAIMVLTIILTSGVPYYSSRLHLIIDHKPAKK